MKLQHAAVIGHPIGHTMSPFIHKRLFTLEGRSVSYQVLDVPDLSASLPALRSLDCFNVTIPHKGAIIPFLDELEENARRFGSVNTVKVEAGRMKGYTTDGAGCYKALENHGVDCSGRVLELEEESLPGHSALGFDLLLNATSVGMYPNTGESPVSGAVLSRCAAVFDAVYNPAQTELLRLAGQAGAKTIGGMEMLVYQEVAAHEIWYGSRFRQEDIALLCQDAQEELSRVFPGKETEKGRDAQ